MKANRVAVLFLLIAAAGTALATGKAEALPRPSIDELASKDPATVDISKLPLGTVESLHETGTPQVIGDIAAWQLVVRGAAVSEPLSLSYEDLQSMPVVKKPVLLVCPGFFADLVEWEGVPVSALLERAGVRADWTRIVFTSWDGYSGRFDREEVDSHVLFLALRVNGQVLPAAHGYPVRLVAEHLSGARWVKWIAEVTLD